MANFNNWANGGQIGNYFAGASGYGSAETEEERRRREYEEAYGKVAPVAPAGPGTAVTPTANAMAAAPQAPMAPQMPQAGIVPPTQPYSGQGLDPRQIQAESGGRDFLPNGQPVTSPKGAMFQNQVMPATAQNPGFGIRPASAQTPEEFNRVGNEYMDVMRKRYKGDEAAALAAYNAGPGTVDKNMSAAGGKLNIPGLPEETQKYINKILPPAQSSSGPVAPGAQIAGGAVASDAYPTPTESAVKQISQPAPQPTTQAPQGEGYYDQKWYDMFQRSQSNPLAMAALANSPQAPAGIKQAAAAQQYSALDIARNQARAEKEVQQIVQQDPTAISKILKEKNEEGSWGKAVLYSLLGSKSLAESEYAKLGKGAAWQNTTDEAGRPVLAQIRADGLPMRGYDITTGTELDAKQLASVAGNIGVYGKPEYTGGSMINDKTGQIGKLVTRNNRTMIESGGRYYSPNAQEGWRQNTVGADLNLANQKQLQQLQNDLANKPKIKAAEYIAEFNAKNGTSFTVDQVVGGAPQNVATQPAGSPQVAPQTAPSTAAPGAVQGGPAATSGGPVSPADIEQKREIDTASKKEIAKEAGAEVAASSETQANLGKIRKAIDILKSGEHNIGSYGSTLVGRGPVAQAIGSFAETPQSQNTEAVDEAVNRVVLMRANLGRMTDADLKFYVKGKPNSTTAPERTQEWLEQAESDLQAKLKQAGKQVDKGGSAGIAPPSTPVTKEDEVMSRADAILNKKK